MQHVLKQSHYVRCLVFELFCKSLCGPQTKEFEDIDEELTRILR